MFFTLACNHTTLVQDGIPRASMSEAGIDSVLINKLATEIGHGEYPNIHSLLIARHNKLVYENYWPGNDENWRRSIESMVHDQNTLHDVRSISKSIVSACIGLAIQQKKIKSVDQKIFDFFPELASQDTGWRSLLTIKHLLSMTSGIAWNEDFPYTDPGNSEIKMSKSRNPLEYVLTQPMESPPGKVWRYNGGNVQLLAEIIHRVSGKQIDKFAGEYLFQPLGINNYEWNNYPAYNIPAAASGLRLRSRDLLKFGLLYNQKGIWNGKQIIDAKWIDESFAWQVSIAPNSHGGYGYLFWLHSDSLPATSVQLAAAMGNGDQKIFIDKPLDLVVVITAGNYNTSGIKKNAQAMLLDYILPAVKQ
jgi:Beta-lactamase class C and other penicillin binding proteins